MKVEKKGNHRAILQRQSVRTRALVTYDLGLHTNHCPPNHQVQEVNSLGLKCTVADPFLRDERAEIFKPNPSIEERALVRSPSVSQDVDFIAWEEYK